MQCKCGSFAIIDDPEELLCDICWRDAKIASLEAKVAQLQKIVDLAANATEPFVPVKTRHGFWCDLRNALWVTEDAEKARKP